MLQLAAIVLVGISAALSGFIITDSIAPQRTPAETAVAAVASVDLPEPTTVTNLPVFDPVEFEAVPGAGFPTAAPVQQPVAVIPSPVADTSFVQALAATVTTLAAQFGALEKLEGRLSGLEARPVSSLSPAVSGGGAAAPVYVNTHGLTQKIDRLENTTITNATISGGSVTAASILGTIANVIDSAVASIDSLAADTLVATNATFTNSTTTNATTTNHYISNLMAAAANVTGDLTVSGTITGGTLSVSGLSSGGAVEAPYFTATSTTATSTFAGGLTAGINGLTVLQNGNVGIGTTAPSTTLHVNDGGLTVGTTASVGTSATVFFAHGTFKDLNYIRSIPSSWVMQYNSFNNHQFLIGGNEKVRITSTGDVGIGTTTPNALLSLYSGASGLAPLSGSTIASESNGSNYLSLLTSGSNQSGIFFGNSNSNSNIDVGILANVSGGRGLQFRTGGNVTAMTIDSSGNVGIGTTIPGSKLEVQGTVAAQLFNATSTTGTTTIALGQGFTIGGSQFVVQQGSGRVGIGSTGPGYTLDVNGDINTRTLLRFGSNSETGFASADHPVIYSTGGGGAAYPFQTAGNLVLQSRTSGASRDIVFVGNTTPAARMIIQGSSGNVGIGETAPGSKLSVSGGGSFGASYDTTAAPSNGLIIEGNVGIGTTSPWRTLSVTGSVGFDGLAGATGAGSLCLDTNKQVVYNAGSDACLPSLRDTKHDILALSLSGTDTIEKLEPVSFVYNEGDGRVRLGFIAENTAAVHSELATYNAAGAISGIDDRAVLSVVVKAFKEMWAHVTGQDQRITAHDTEIAALNARIASLEAQLGAASAAVPTASTATIELLINGNNPALLAAGESYVDLGATASSSDTTLLALGIRTFVDDTAVETVVVDTSITATTTITYRVIDGDGAVLAEAERTVVVSDPVQSEPPAEQTTDEPSEPMSNN